MNRPVLIYIKDVPRISTVRAKLKCRLRYPVLHLYLADLHSVYATKYSGLMGSFSKLAKRVYLYRLLLSTTASISYSNFLYLQSIHYSHLDRLSIFAQPFASPASQALR